MPVRITKRGSCYRVSTPNSVHAKCTSKRNAEAQKRIIDAAEHGHPIKKKRKK